MYLHINNFLINLITITHKTVYIYNIKYSCMYGIPNCKPQLSIN